MQRTVMSDARLLLSMTCGCRTLQQDLNKYVSWSKLRVGARIVVRRPRGSHDRLHLPHAGMKRDDSSHIKYQCGRHVHCETQSARPPSAPFQKIHWSLFSHIR